MQVKNSEDVADFMKFCDAWSCVLHSHHNTEETVYFPLLEDQTKHKGVMAHNHEEHETFVPGLLAFDAFIGGIKDRGAVYDAPQLLKLIDDFGPALEKHLHNEVGVLEELGKDEQINWDLMGKTMAAHSKKVADRIREVPFLITNSDVTYEAGIHGERFPPFPWFVGQIFRWVYIPMMKGAWRFSSCDDYGVPKELPLA